jgi:hypothetical protein
VTIFAPTTPPSLTYTVSVRVSCAPSSGHTYLLADRIEDIGQYKTTNVYPKRLLDSSAAMDTTAPTAIPHTYLVYSVPDAELAEVRAKLGTDQYWYNQQPIPATFDVVGAPVTVTPRP